MTTMTEPTSRHAAEAAKVSADRRLNEAKGTKDEVRQLSESLRGILEDNHFSVRLARAFGLEDDRK